MVTISVPADKAKALEKISQASAVSLEILASKVDKHRSQGTLPQLEGKLKTFAPMI